MTDHDKATTEAIHDSALGTEAAPDFAAFEAKANEPDTPDDPPADDPNVNDRADDPEDFDAPPDETPEAREKRRSKPLRQRLGEVTEKWRNEQTRSSELEKRIAALEADKPEPKVEDELAEPDPNDDKYEFGEADPKYLADLTDYKVEKRLRDREKSDVEKQDAEKAREAQATAVRELDSKWTEQQAKGVEKYDDFTDAIKDFSENAPCPPLMAAAISDSPVGADVAYHLAKNQPEAHVLAARLQSGDVIGAATAFGEIEGHFLDKAPDKPATDHPLDVAIYAGRLKGFAAKPKAKVATDAPEPPPHRVRGGSGKFEVGADTTDFAAFERKANAR